MNGLPSLAVTDMQAQLFKVCGVEQAFTEVAVTVAEDEINGIGSHSRGSDDSHWPRTNAEEGDSRLEFVDGQAEG